eukprot:scaffold458_cov150-Amphora_coffeaeformis.AAC.2
MTERKLWRRFAFYGIAIHAILHTLSISLFSTRELKRSLSLASENVDGLLPLVDKLGGTHETQHQEVEGVSDYEFLDDKLVLAMISLGNATKGTHVQRAIRSARARGGWKGRIAVITDDEEAYADVVEKDASVYLIRPRREDWQDMPEFTHEKMKIKRFKTLLLEYILNDTRMRDAEFVLYLDIDIILTKPLVPWLQNKWNEGRVARTTVKPNLSTMYMFSESPGKGMAAHSGLILLHKDLSQGCLIKWRELMEIYRDKAPRDQWLIRKMRKNPDRMQCKIRAWPLNSRDMLFPEPGDLEKRIFPQFVHMTNTYRAKWIDADLQKAYYEDALLLTEGEKNDPTSLAFVPQHF